MAITASWAHAKGVEDPRRLLRRGYRLLRKGDIVAAELTFRRAVALDISSPEAWRALASTQLGARHAICLRWADVAAATAPRALRTRAAQHGGRLARVALGGTLGLAAALGLLVAGSDLAYSRRVLPNVSIAGVDVGNLPLDRLDDAIAARRSQIAGRVVRLQADGHEVRVSLDALLVDTGQQLARQAAGFGHQPAFLDRAATRLDALWGDEIALGQPQVDARAVEHTVAELARSAQRPVRDARLQRHGSGWEVAPEQAGRTLDRAGAAAALRRLLVEQAWDVDAAALVLPIATRPLEPRVTATQLLPIRDRLRELAARPLTLAAGEQSWTLDASTLVGYDAAAGAASVRPDRAAIAGQLEPIAAALLIAPQPSRLEREGRRVRALVPGQPGRQLDREAAASLIAAAVDGGNQPIALPLRPTAPPPGEIEQLGLLGELGRGESQFVTYSSPNRDANVLAGGRDVDGVLLAPGEVFSFNDTVGWIGPEKGYQWGEAIENGAVVPSLGGGICQVSTTVFRAAFWSGLELVERHNHMWRLPWYEVDAPAGMDATIALGGPDLRFRNNTGHHILIRVETDLANKRQTVILYGTPDGRHVEMLPLADGNIGVLRSVVAASGSVANEAFVSYYTQ